MKKLYFVLLFFLPMLLFGQKDKFPVRKYDGKKDQFRPIINGAEHLPLFTIYYGYHQTAFLNPAFSYNFENDYIERKFGGVLKLQYFWSPLLIDFDWFSSRFIVNNFNNTYQWTFPDDMNVRHSGVSISVSYVFPELVQTRYLIPYVGIGGQLSGICDNITSFIKSDDGAEGRFVQTHAAFWKIGIMSWFLEHYSVAFEYKRSIAFNSDKGFNQLGILIGLTYEQ